MDWVESKQALNINAGSHVLKGVHWFFDGEVVNIFGNCNIIECFKKSTTIALPLVWRYD